MQPAINVQNLGKKYVLRHMVGSKQYVALRDVLAQKVSALFGRNVVTGAREEFWALRNVSFEVKPGEAVGIIGRNGAGKSTLLKLLSRITKPTEGRIEIAGRVASLLEVGTGFHPELTGRENIYLNGAIMGMARSEIKKNFDAIVDFAEVEKFLDTPVKRYSSGMYMRLAFAVSAHLEPEILIVDEVLAVGDVSFQKKCLGKMQDVSKRQGRTVLFVSHNMTAITDLTQRCIYLANGQIVANGPTSGVVQEFLASGGLTSAVYQSKATYSPRVDRIEIKTSRPNNVQASGESLEIDFIIEHTRPRHGLCFSFQLINQFGAPAAHMWVYDPEQPICRESGRTKLSCRIPKLHLNVGMYYFRVFLSDPPGGEFYETFDPPLSFEVSILERTTLYGWRPEVCTYLEDFSWSSEPA